MQNIQHAHLPQRKLLHAPTRSFISRNYCFISTSCLILNCSLVHVNYIDPWFHYCTFTPRIHLCPDLQYMSCVNYHILPEHIKFALSNSPHLFSWIEMLKSHLFTRMLKSQHLFTYMSKSQHLFTWMLKSQHLFTYMSKSQHLFTGMLKSQHLLTYMSKSQHLFTSMLKSQMVHMCIWPIE